MLCFQRWHDYCCLPDLRLCVAKFGAAGEFFFNSARDMAVPVYIQAHMIPRYIRACKILLYFQAKVKIIACLLMSRGTNESTCG